MCTALKELENEGKIEGIVKTCREFGASEETAAEKLQKECGLEIGEAIFYMSEAVQKCIS